MPEIGSFVDRKNDSRWLENAIVEGQSLMLCGAAGIGKTALASKVIAGLPAGWAGRCLHVRGAKDLRGLLYQLICRLYEAENPNVRRLLRAEGVAAVISPASLRKVSTSRMKGIIYTSLDGGDYRVFFDHLPPLTKAAAKVIKELFWMRHTPVYLLVRDEAPQRIEQVCRFFYWGEQERLTLLSLPPEAAAELLQACVERFGLTQLELSDFRREVLALSRGIPGAIVNMCMLAGQPRYQFGSRIKTKAVYIDYLLRGVQPNPEV